MEKRKKYFWLFLIVTLAAIIRLSQFWTIIPDEGIWQTKIIWYDEAYSIYYTQLPWQQVWELSGFDTTPVLFYAILKIWSFFVGTNIIFLSILPFLFSLAGVFAIYFLGLKIFNPQTGLLVGLFLAISPLNISLATELRAYSFLVLLTILALIFFWQVLKRGQWFDYLFFIILNLLLIYTHYLGLVVLLTQLVLLLYFKNKSWLKILGSYFVIGLLYLPQIFNFQRWDNLLGNNDQLVSYFERVFSHGYFFSLWQFGHSLFFGHWGAHNLLFLFSGSLVLFFLFFIFYQNKQRQEVQVLFLFMVFGFIFLILFKLFFALKYFIILTIPFILLLGYFLAQLKNKKMLIANLLLGLALIFSCLNLPVSKIYASQYYAPEFAGFITSEEKAGDLILTDHYTDILLPFYYQGKSDLKMFYPWEGQETADWSARWRYFDYNIINKQNVSLVSDFIKNHQRVWLINYLPQESSLQDPNGYLKKFLLENFDLVLEKRFPQKIENIQQTELLLFDLRK